MARVAYKYCFYSIIHVPKRFETSNTDSSVQEIKTTLATVDIL